MLTKEQKAGAIECLLARPPVFPGSRAIISTQAREEWYDRVSGAMARLGVAGAADVNYFCNLAGVPD